ncbi:MAG: ion transporter [Myxococcota bacterium]
MGWGQLVWEAHHVPGTRAHTATQTAIWVLIAVSIGALVAELAWEPVPPELDAFLRKLDVITLFVFSAELILRVLSHRPPELELLEGGPGWRLRCHIVGRLRYLASPLVALDLLTVLAFMPALRGLRALRMVRLLAGIRFFPYSNPILGVLRAFAESWLLYASTLGFLAIVMVVGGLSLYLLESGRNPAVSTPADGVWWALVTLTTVGFGDITPITSAGRWVAGAVMILGMFTVALFAGIVTTTLLGVLVRLRAEQFRMSGQAHHIIVCGYEPGSRQLLDALLEEKLPGPPRELILFGTGGRPSDVPAEFTWVEGDPTRESQLAKVRPEHASAVVLVGRRSRPPQESDASTILTLFTLRRYLAARPRARKRPLYLIAEVLDAENVDHARAAGADEVIETTRLGFAMMAHSVTAPGSGAVMSRVASSSAASIYIGRAPIEASEAYGELVRRLHATQGLTVLGLSDPDSGEVRLAPEDTDEVLPGQGLVYLANAARLEPV